MLPGNKIKSITNIVQKVTHIWDKAKTASTIDLFSFPLSMTFVSDRV